MTTAKNKRAYTLVSLVKVSLEELALAILLLWLLPRFGINIPIWLTIIFMVIWAGYSYLTSVLVVKVMDKATTTGLEALVGVKGITTTLLSPEGYIRIGNELWQACSKNGDIKSGVEVVIVGNERLTLFVIHLKKTGQARRDVN